MSRIGNRVLTIPENVNIECTENSIKVTGPKGSLTAPIEKNIEVKLEDKNIIVTRKNEDKKTKQMHGTTNAIINNMIIGVSEGYKKGLEIIGVGYRFAPKGNVLTINAGYSHQVNLNVPEGLTVKGISNTEIEIEGIDKCAVGEFAANIRKVREPEPYKGKGIKYAGEHIRRKEGKKASK